MLLIKKKKKVIAFPFYENWFDLGTKDQLKILKIIQINEKFNNYTCPKKLKRVKNKNLIKVLNKPLIFWTINYAKKFNKKNYDIVVSSDCNKVKKICDKEKSKFFKKTKKDI